MYSIMRNNYGGTIDMSRMDRYKKVHEESKQASKHPIRTHRELAREKREQENSEEFLAESLYEDDYLNEVHEISKIKKKRKDKKQSNQYYDNYERKPKKRKKHRIFRFLIKLLLLVLIYSGGAFFAGQFVANMDDSYKMEVETFNGFSGSEGANNILLIGNDSREGETSRADTIMVLQLDGPAKKPKLISFMRDTYVNIPDIGEDKLNSAYAYGGAELVRKTLSLNFGIETKYYTSVNFQTFEKVIDTLFPSGVDIEAEKDMSTYLEVPIQQGQQKMDGLTLLQYARFRMDEEGDFGRVRRQQQVMNAVFSQMKNPLSIIKLPYAAGKVMGYASTDLPISFLLKNTFSIAKGASGVDRLSIPVEGSWYYGETYHAGSVLVIDSEMNQSAIREFLQK